MDYETTSPNEAMVRSCMMKIMLNHLTDDKLEFPFRYPKIRKSAYNFLGRVSDMVVIGPPVDPESSGMRWSPSADTKGTESISRTTAWCLPGRCRRTGQRAYREASRR